jgi:hypothetical protein
MLTVAMMTMMLLMMPQGPEDRRIEDLFKHDLEQKEPVAGRLHRRN